MELWYLCLLVLVLCIAAKMHRRRKNRNKVIHVDRELCSGCGRCVKRCNHKVLTLEKHGARALAVVTSPESCSACGDCISKCNANALSLILRPGTDQSPQ